uniref:Uncharacterized protein n=1 Tax=Arundo donax TaxID=35708 RepID=A0A0A9DDH5_ARUDO
MLAWLLSRRRHACSGGAPPSKSSSCSAVRPTYSSAGHEFFRQWKMLWPLTIPAGLEMRLATPPQPQPHRPNPPRAARCRSEVQASAADVSSNTEDPRAGRPHSLPPRPRPRRSKRPARQLLMPRASPQRDRFGAGGPFRRGRDSD